MPARVSPTERIRAEIDQLFTADQDLGQILEEVARLGARLLLQAALEAEVTQFLGRDRYARGERIRPGHRNGHAPATVKTTAGPVTLERPKLRGTDQAFASRLLGKGVPAPVQAGRRWVVERTHAWMNGYGKLRRCTERDGKIVDFYLYLAAAFVVVRRLIQQARTRYRWATRPTTKRLK